MCPRAQNFGWDGRVMRMIKLLILPSSQGAWFVVCCRSRKTARNELFTQWEIKTTKRTLNIIK